MTIGALGAALVATVLLFVAVVAPDVDESVEDRATEAYQRRMPIRDPEWVRVDLPGVSAELPGPPYRDGEWWDDTDDASAQAGGGGSGVILAEVPGYRDVSALSTMFALLDGPAIDSSVLAERSIDYLTAMQVQEGQLDGVEGTATRFASGGVTYVGVVVPTSDGERSIVLAAAETDPETPMFRRAKESAEVDR